MKPSRERDIQRYCTIFSCWRFLRSSISRSRALSILFLRSWFGREPVGSSTCFTAMSKPVEASIPRYTFPNEPAPISAPFIHLFASISSQLEEGEGKSRTHI